MKHIDYVLSHFGFLAYLTDHKMMLLEKPKVIYIAGSGHSGSTLTDMIIGSSDNVVSLGELEFLRDFVNDRDTPNNINHPLSTCLCKKKFRNCKFWGPIVKKTDIRRTYCYRSSLPEKIKIVLSIYFPFIRIKLPYDDTELLKNIIEQASKLKGDHIEYVLDSSKDIRRLVYLASLKNINLKVIHLVRDSRGVVNSFEKRGRNWIIILGEWIIENFLIKKFLQNRIKKRNFLGISYYNFTENPKRELKRINKQFGLKVETENFVDKVNAEEYHHVSGNPLNMKKLEKIRRDISWKKNLPSWKKAIIRLLTFPLNKKLVYEKK